MGRGSLKRIAALATAATIAVMVVGVVNVAALPGLPSTPQVTTTVPTTTVPSTTVTVPATPVAPQTTVTTPTVTTPKVSVPAPAPPKVSAPTVSAPKVSAPTVKQQPSSTSLGGGGGGSTLEQQTGAAIDTVSGLTQSGTSGAVSGTRDRVGGTSGGTLTGSGGGGGGSGSSAGDALAALGFFGGSSGAGGASGPGGTSGSGGGIFGSGAAGGRGGGGLPPTLSAAGAKQLRSALELLEGCMSAIAPIDRQVLGMRAGAPGAAPLSRSQVAAKLGVSTRQVRLSERRGLSGLRTAAEQTGCAGPVGGGPFAVSGIGPLSLATLGAAPGALAAAQGARADGGNYVAARQAQPGGTSPLAGLGGSGQSGPAWLVVLFTVLFSVSIAGLLRELRGTLGT
jgi:hypothetical protein